MGALTSAFIIPALLALFFSFFLTPIVRQFSRSIGMVDFPGERKIHSLPMPLGGGIILFFAFFIPVWLFIDRTYLYFTVSKNMVIGFFLGGLFIVFLGVLDDIKPIKPVTKLAGQTFAAVILFWSGFRIDILTNPFGGVVQLQNWSILFTVLWVISLVNAMNLIDGLDGLASGVSFIVAITLSIIGWHQGELQITFFSLLLSGAILGLIRYNYYPASIFLGDSGSMFLGFSLAAIALMGNRKSTTAIALLFPLVMGLMLPIADTFTAIIRRWGQGKPIFLGDSQHLHHRLLNLGLTQKQVVNAFYLLTAYLCIHAFVFVVIEIRYALIIIVLLAIGLFFAFRILFFMEKHLTEQNLNLKEKENAENILHRTKTKPPQKYHIFFWEKFFEKTTKKVIEYSFAHFVILIIIMFIPLIFFILHETVSLNLNLMKILHAKYQKTFLIHKSFNEGEFETGTPIILSADIVKYWQNNTLRFFSQNNKELFIAPFRIKNTGNSTSQNVWLPFPELNSAFPGKIFLYNSFFFKWFKKPQEVEYYPPPKMETSGINIVFWKRESLQRDENIFPAIGNYMTKVTLQVKPVTGDHLTNNLIDYVHFHDLQLFSDSYLEYFIRRGNNNMLPAGTPDIRFSVQATINGNFTDMIMPDDQNGKSGKWFIDLTNETSKHWYFRRIPLGKFAGSKLNELYLMLNDYPDLQVNSSAFASGKDGYFTFYFDGISIVRRKGD